VTGIHARSRPQRGLALPTALTLVGLVALVWLGNWQLERRTWKETLIATLGERLTASATALPPPVRWGVLDQKEMEFRRVSFPAEFLHGDEALIYTAGSSLRPDVSGPGYWALTPARLLGGSVVMVNRGFVPEAHREQKARPEGQVAGVVEILGVLRWPEARGQFTPADDPDRNTWYVRDHLAVAVAKKLGPVAPFYIDQEAPPAPGGLPKVGPLKVNLPNNHLQYAVTWFGLALALLSVFLIWAFRRPR
jgi:surfeit locus 1 family protein